MEKNCLVTLLYSVPTFLTINYSNKLSANKVYKNESYFTASNDNKIEIEAAKKLANLELSFLGLCKSRDFINTK